MASEQFRIQCRCGKTHDVPSTLLGRKIRCMSCEKILKVKQPRVTGDVKPVGLGSMVVEGTRECPGCKKVYFEDDKICIKCGINLTTGAVLYASTSGQGSQSWSSIDPPEGGGFFRGLLGKLFGR